MIAQSDIEAISLNKEDILRLASEDNKINEILMDRINRNSEKQL